LLFVVFTLSYQWRSIFLTPILGDKVVPPLQEASNYMELQPTRRRQEPAEVAAQYMNTMSQYQPLTRRTEKDPKPKRAYENVDFQGYLEKKGNGGEIYEEVNA